MSLDTDTHGPFICSDSEQNEKGRKLGQNSLIITGQAMGFQDRSRTEASNGNHCARQNTTTDNQWEYSCVISKMKFNTVSSGCPDVWVDQMDVDHMVEETGAVVEI